VAVFDAHFGVALYVIHAETSTEPVADRRRFPSWWPCQGFTQPAL